MASAERLLSTIDALYGAALDPELWDEALATVAESFGARGATFEVHGKRFGKLRFFRDFGMPADGVERYLAHYHRICPRLPSPDAPAGNVDYDHKFLSESEIRRHEFYQDFLVPASYKYFLSGTLANDADEFTIFCVHFGLERAHPQRREIELLQRLMPHLKHAVDLHLALAGRERHAGETQDALERFSAGVLIVDAAGRVAYANQAARKLLAERRGLTLDRALRARNRGDQVRLERLLKSAVLAQSGEPRASGGQMLVRGEGGAPLAVLVSPLASARRRRHWLDRGQAGAAGALVVIQDVARPPELDDDLLIEGLRLTPAEARLARALVAGERLPAYARRQRVSHNTVRSQLAQIRDKLGLSGQLEIVSLLARLSPPLDS